MTLSGRTAVITGAAGELGTLLARDLAEQGANLALLGRDRDRLEGVRLKLALPEGRIFTKTADMLKPDQAFDAAQAVFDHFGRIDILVHLVGGWIGGKSLVESSRADLENMLNQHVWSTFHVFQAFTPFLVKNGWGRLVVISSPAAQRPGPGSAVYAAGKAGQEALVLALAQELRGSRVTANILTVKTIDIARDKVQHPTPENRSWSTPEEISEAVRYLFSEAGGAVSGARIPLFGGSA